jgi:hypothetical protein
MPKLFQTGGIARLRGEHELKAVGIDSAFVAEHTLEDAFTIKLHPETRVLPAA